MKEPARKTAALVAHPSTAFFDDSGVLILSRQCHAEVAKAAGARYGPVLGGDDGSENGWRRLGYLYKEPQAPPDSDFFRGGKRPWEEAEKDRRASAEAAMRQLRGEVDDLREACKQARLNRRREPDYKARREAFRERHGRQWWEIAASYFAGEDGEEPDRA
jgi:hypothetical protein